VHVEGRFSDYVRISDEGDHERTFHFCPDCGSTVFYTTSDAPDLIAVAVGAFADPSFPPPTVSVYDSRRHPWVALADTIQPDLWESLRPFYELGAYEEAADRGRELIETHPENAELLYNVACCESLTGRAADAIGHLRRAIDRSNELRALAADDSDFDPIRDAAVDLFEPR
jgi:tetratricopeptide (TPR) repeat protein